MQARELRRWQLAQATFRPQMGRSGVLAKNWQVGSHLPGYFPLTPALSLGERGQHLAPLEKEWAWEIRGGKTWRTSRPVHPAERLAYFPLTPTLSLGERGQHLAR